MKNLFIMIAAIVLLCLGVVSQALPFLETVTISTAGNADDTTGYGSVGYDYKIGKYEVTSGQYIAFLNAKATLSDDYGLYNSNMWNGSYACRIQKTTSSGVSSYSVASGYANMPVNYVSWYDSLRFANWMTNGQGSSSTETGSYTIINGGVDDGTVTISDHSPGSTTKWFLTSEDEWYKAAYYTGSGYSLYANGTNVAPGKGTDSNYGTDAGPPVPATAWDGSVMGTVEQNGTKDMMGNVWEWNEAVINDDYRGLRGGSFGNVVVGNGYLQSSCRFDAVLPTYESGAVGFRVSEVPSVPEPSSFMAVGFPTLMLGLGKLRRLLK